MVMRALSRKLLRDVWHTRSQGLAISLVIAAGVAMFIAYFSTFDSLRLAQRTYYDRFRFADVFVMLKRAPLGVADDLAAIPGIARVTARVVVDVALDIPGMIEPATGRLISIPAREQPILNEPFLRRGRRPEGGDEVLASEGFALAHGFAPGDSVAATINGRRRRLRIVGIALSPEYIYTIRPGEIVPDNARFGIFWMERRSLAAAFNMEGAFNDASFALMRGASEPEAMAAIDRVVAPYGSLGAVARRNQLSNWFIENELTQLQTMGVIIPAIFLGVSAFLLNIVLTRLIAVQREQIAALKALGYTNREIAAHYVSWAVAIALAGTVFGVLGGIWLGSSITSLYNDFFRFPTLRYVLAPVIVVEGTLISLSAAALGAIGAVMRAVRLPPAEAMRPEPPARHTLTWLDRALPRRLAPPPMKMILRNLQRQPVRAGLSCARRGVRRRHSHRRHVFSRRDRGDSRRAVQRGPAPGLHGRVRRTAIRAGPARAGAPARRAGRRADPHRCRRASGRATGRGRRRSPGCINASRLQRVIDTSLAPVASPPTGSCCRAKLAEILDIRAGDMVQVELLEGARPVRTVVVAALVDEYMGTSAYMEIAALQRFMREGPTMSGAALLVDNGDRGRRSTAASKRRRRSPGSARSARPLTTSATRSRRT